MSSMKVGDLREHLAAAAASAMRRPEPEAVALTIDRTKAMAVALSGMDPDAEVDPETLATLQFEKFSDAEFRKQFLFRERFIQETTETSYLSLIRSKPQYTLSTILTKRVNRFDSVKEELPTVALTINDAPIGETQLFYRSEYSYQQLTNKPASPTDLDDDVTRIHSYNQLSYATKLGFLSLTPRVGMTQTYFSKDNQSTQDEHERNIIRSAWHAGAEVTTRFFRIFNVHSNALGLDLNLLRHVISPSVSWSAVRKPTR